ncbi:LOW QUALITY PROTEIN: GDSL esterase/lipase 1-like [Cajanus cajan]|uniref:LOW QUALITY PROTEIN: GDSL esterase/lipase 1-like n=1 Tax=Cajanus cajan TaxID=3821 RepID=UPI00098D7E9F|nr:LOW QUALITY PROTEIN: GDSL esterase/lipase 1-like [Cajanus cajan]
MGEGLNYFLVFSLGIMIQITHCHSSMGTCLPEKHAALFIFGDSLFDNGNNNYINTTTSYQANYPPYGQTFFKYPSGRFSDGRMIPDFVAEFAKLPLLPPYLHPIHEYMYGVNFASGGAGALRETSQGMVIDLKTQVSYLRNVNKLFSQRLGQAKAEEMLSKSVHLFSIGSNDYGTLLDPNSTVLLPVNHQEFVDIVIGNLTDVIKEIYNLGGRKFGFFNVGPIGCSPAIRNWVNNGSTGPCFEEFSAIARLHNIALTKMLHELEKHLKGFKYSVTDFYSAVSQVLNNPTEYGFKEASVACCGGGAYRGDDSCGGNKGIKEYELCDNVDQHLFFDSHHPTDRASQHFAELIWNGNRTVTSPYNLKQLFEV